MRFVELFCMKLKNAWLNQKWIADAFHFLRDLIEKNADLKKSRSFKTIMSYRYFPRRDSL